MNLKKISVDLQADGFRIDDHHSGLEPGTTLSLQYEVPSGWVSKEVVFQPDPPTLLHPFRKSMFVYTGETPRRLVVRLAGVDLSRAFERDWSYETRRSYYEENDFFTYPDFFDNSWSGAEGMIFIQPPFPDMPPAGGVDVPPGDSPTWQQADEMAERRPGVLSEDGGVEAQAGVTFEAQEASGGEPNAY